MQCSTAQHGLAVLDFGVLCLQVNLCLLQASVEEGSPSCTNKCITHVSLVALCFDKIATQFRMNRYYMNHCVCYCMYSDALLFFDHGSFIVKGV